MTQDDPARVVSQVVRTVLDRWIARGDAAHARDVNHAGGGGCCVDFADEVLAELPQTLVQCSDVFDFGLVNVLAPGPDGCAGEIPGSPFDRTLLARHWPDCVPPQGLSWDNLDRASAANGFDARSHYWVVCDGTHFDAECPEGTRNLFDLPWMRRALGLA